MKRRDYARSLVSAIAGFFDYAKKVFALLWTDLTRNDILHSSAEMLYYTIVSIVPFFVTVFPILSTFGLFERAYNDLNSSLSNVLGSSNTDYILNILDGYIKRGFGLGFYGFIVFAFSSALLVDNVKKLFDRIFRIEPERVRESLPVRMVKYFVYIIGFAFSVSLLSFAHSFIYGHFGMASVISTRFVRKLVFAVFAGLLVFVIFIRFSPVYVSPRNAAAGSVVFVIGAELLNAVMSYLVKYSFRIQSHLYGSAAAFIITLLWVNYLWKVLMVSADLVYIIQYKPDFSKNERMNITQTEQNALEIMYAIVDGFRRGIGGERLDVICERLSLATQFVLEICEKFIDAGLIYPVGKLNARTYTVALPTKDISVYYVLRAIEGDADDTRKSSWVFDDIKNLEVDRFLRLPIEQLYSVDKGN